MSIWSTPFLRRNQAAKTSKFPQESKYALIILNQPFSTPLFRQLWDASEWRCCADGGANRLYDLEGIVDKRECFLPNLIKGDLDSARPAVLEYYGSKGVAVIHDRDQDSTDLMKCVAALTEIETRENVQYDLIILGGLSGRLDQTVHTLSYLHKLRKQRNRVFAVTDESVGWVLDTGEHTIEIEHNALGPTCGLLPVGIGGTILSTRGLRWNLSNTPSSFDGMVSTSNHLVPGCDQVWVKTSKPLWWTAELRPF